MDLFKISKSYILSKNNNTMTKIHALISMIGITIGITALIVVSSSLNGFKTTIYNKINQGYDIKISSDINNLKKIEEYLKTDEYFKIKNIEIVEELLNYKFKVNNQASFNLYITDKIDNEIEIQKIYFSENIKDYINNPTPNEELYLPAGFFKNDVMIEQDFFKIGFKKNLCDSCVLMSKETFDMSFFTLEKPKQILITHLNNFMDAFEYNSYIKNKYPNYDVEAWYLNKKNMFDSLRLEETIIKIVLFFIILISCFNIISTTTLITTEKKQDIYILKTIGYSNKDVIKIFLYTGIIIGTMGLFLGTILGIILTKNMTEILNMIGYLMDLRFIPESIKKFPHIINYQEIIIVNILTFIVIIFSSILPAYKTAKISPAEGLKNE